MQNSSPSAYGRRPLDVRSMGKKTSSFTYGDPGCAAPTPMPFESIGIEDGDGRSGREDVG